MKLKRQWRIDGPFFKPAEEFLAADGECPEAPAPGYGWPLGSECCYFKVYGFGWRAYATGLTLPSALRRAATVIEQKEAQVASEAAA